MRRYRWRRSILSTPHRSCWLPWKSWPKLLATYSPHDSGSRVWPDVPALHSICGTPKYQSWKPDLDPRNLHYSHIWLSPGCTERDRGIWHGWYGWLYGTRSVSRIPHFSSHWKELSNFSFGRGHKRRSIQSFPCRPVQLWKGFRISLAEIYTLPKGHRPVGTRNARRSFETVTRLESLCTTKSMGVVVDCWTPRPDSRFTWGIVGHCCLLSRTLEGCIVGVESSDLLREMYNKLQELVAAFIIESSLSWHIYLKRMRNGGPATYRVFSLEQPDSTSTMKSSCRSIVSHFLGLVSRLWTFSTACGCIYHILLNVMFASIGSRTGSSVNITSNKCAINYSPYHQMEGQNNLVHTPERM